MDEDSYDLTEEKNPIYSGNKHEHFNDSNKNITKNDNLTINDSDRKNDIYLVFSILPIQKGACFPFNANKSKESLQKDEEKLTAFLSDVSMIIPDPQESKVQSSQKSQILQDENDTTNNDYYIFGSFYNNNMLDGFSCTFKYKKYTYTKDYDYIFKMSVNDNELRMIHKMIKNIISLQSINTHKLSNLSFIHQTFSIMSQKFINVFKSIQFFNCDVSLISDSDSEQDVKNTDAIIEELPECRKNNSIIIDMDEFDNTGSINITHGHSVEVVCIILQNSMNILKNVTPHDLTPNNLWMELYTLTKNRSLEKNDNNESQIHNSFTTNGNSIMNENNKHFISVIKSCDFSLNSVV